MSESSPPSPARKQMIINYVDGEECRIAILADRRLDEMYQERTGAGSHVGNIYKGRVTNVEPAIQAAFVDFGLDRNGFLHVSDLHPRYFPGKDREESERVGIKTPRRDRPPIQKCLKRGDDILVQVLKEGIGTKGPTLTSYLSIPGRFLVMMPFMEKHGVTRKVEDDEARREMRRILDELDPPEGFGFIVRTAGMGQTKTELKRDLAYLMRLWKSIERRRDKGKRVGELFAESDLVVRTIRDVFSPEIERIVCDHPIAAHRARDFLSIANPRSASQVFVYHEPEPIFDRFGIETQIEQISSRTVPLPSGGSLVIEQTEALVAIDVNSGKFRDHKDAETTAYRTNLEAADEICRQLRLRDLGGVIINDLIDMGQAKHRKAIEQRFRENLKTDRARTRIGSISSFGILEMTRQRMRPSLTSSVHKPCDHCSGIGHTKSAESVVLEVMRRLEIALGHDRTAQVELTISPDVAFQLLNRKRSHLTDIERRHQKHVLVRVGGHRIDFVKITAMDERGQEFDPQALRRRDEPTLAPVEPRTGQEMDELEGELSIDPGMMDPGTPLEHAAEPEATPPSRVTSSVRGMDDTDGEERDSAEAADADVDAESAQADEQGDSPESGRGAGKASESGEETGEETGEVRRRRRRRRRRGKGGASGATHGATGGGVQPKMTASMDAGEAESSSQESTDSGPVTELDSGEGADSGEGGESGEGGDGGEGGGEPARRRRRRRRRRGRGGGGGNGGGNGGGGGGNGGGGGGGGGQSAQSGGSSGAAAGSTGGGYSNPRVATSPPPADDAA